MTKILNRHTIKTGFVYRKLFLNFWQESIPAGSFSFDATWSQQVPTQASSDPGIWARLTVAGDTNQRDANQQSIPRDPQAVITPGISRTISA